MENELQEKLKAIRHSGEILGDALYETLNQVKPGVTELELNNFADKYIVDQGGYPGFKKVPGYKHALCVATNDVVVHGIPKKRKLTSGDIICLDLGVYYGGYHTDMAETKFVGVAEVPKEIKKFLTTGKQAMWDGIAQALPGNRVGHISQAIQKKVEREGYSVVPNLVGHGVGKTLHEKPEIPGILMRPIEKTPLLKPGMTIAIEVIYNMGGPDVAYDGSDDWTIVTVDGSLSAVFERSLEITEKGYKLLTRLPDDPTD